MLLARLARPLYCCYSAFWLKGLFGTDFLAGSETKQNKSLGASNDD
ncbi:MAG: hypothetical protein ACI88G_000884 [Woeseiaceae bacterium]|jgi:hypothetical protein